jgi:hypothetical protein
MIGRLYTHTINVYRPTSTILDGVTVLMSHSIGVTYTQGAVVEISIPDSDATFTVTGLVNGLTTSSSVVFSSGGTTFKKITDTAFNRLISITGTTGTAETFSARVIGKSGQGIMHDELIYDTLYCRMDNVGGGTPFSSKAVSLNPDEVFCFVSGENVYEHSIKSGDIVIEGWTLDETGLGTVSTKRYVVKNVNSFYGRSSYRYTELVLAKID